MEIEVWTGRSEETGHPVLTVVVVMLILVLAFVAGRKTHGHDCGGCPKCDRICALGYEAGFEAGFEAGEREATVDWGEWK